MALTLNGHMTGKAASNDLRDFREQLREDADKQAERTAKRTQELTQKIADCLTADEYYEWWKSTPDSNAAFLQACEDKWAELEAAELAEVYADDPITAAEIKRDSDMVAELVKFPTRFIVTRTWAERHLNVEVNGYEAELDKAFGAGNWTLAGGG